MFRLLVRSGRRGSGFRDTLQIPQDEPTLRTRGLQGESSETESYQIAVQVHADT